MSKPTGKLIRVTPEGIGAVPAGNIIQATGDSPTKIMSQKAVTDALKTSVNMNSIYPIGIVVWFAQNKNPNTLFPGTKWQYIGENKTIRLANSDGSNILKSGGSDTVTLTEAQLPAHNHSFSATTSNFDYGTKKTVIGGKHSHSIKGRFVAENGGGEVALGIDNKYNREATINEGGEHSHDITIGAHTHTVSGTTGNKGNNSTIIVINTYIMLMGWYRLS